MLYLAYGSNLNVEDMLYRCPNAVKAGQAFLENHRLVYRGTYHNAWLNVEPAQGYRVPVGVWQIHDSDEANMDVYEDYPALYDKKMIEIILNGEKKEAMIYIMNPGYACSEPDPYYVSTCRKGYSDFGFDESILDAAFDYSVKNA
ncbi:MAG: gamma-glutamylcyclotransferase family protein [Bulleidia sp.]